MPTKLPAYAAKVASDFPAIWSAFEALGTACGAAGPLDARTQRLVKLGIAVALRSEGAVHSHMRRALAEGVTPAELRHAILLAIPTIGFPATVAALSWADDILAAVGAAEKPHTRDAPHETAAQDRARRPR
jgi:alkylhydroperoxidase/carboxymuconolactone decarboxylase family protein YurZ